MKGFVSFAALWLAAWACVGLADQLELHAPVEWQVIQRQTEAEGLVRLQGQSSKGTVVDWRVTGQPKSGVLSNNWEKIPVGGNGEFSADVALPAGGWYRIDIRATRDGAVVAERRVEHVGVGEVFLVAGQSNSANHGEERQSVRSGKVAAFVGPQWQPANDPQPGASGDGGSFLPPFADATAESLGVPIGLVAIGVGATSVREWLPSGTLFPNPPTLTGNVVQLASGEWESTGRLFSILSSRLQLFGPRGVRAVLWHQGESDANQKDASRTLPGTTYQALLGTLIRESRRAAGWEVPWFVAQVSYHTPDDPGSEEIRAAQQALWDSGVALPGPDTDALAGSYRDSGGQGVHFSGPGLREHAARWVKQVQPWLVQQLAQQREPKPASSNRPTRLRMPQTEDFTIAGRPAFLYVPPESRRSRPQPWILYAPALPPYPDEAERWMHEQFLAAGIAVAGVDVGEAYGSPSSHEVFNALYRDLVDLRGFATKPCLFGRSRGGLWVSSWAIAHPDRVAGIIGIYPVYDYRTYPGLTNAAPAYGLTPRELDLRSASLNPIERIAVLAEASIPIALIHGDQDRVVPLRENSAELVRRYREAGMENLVKLIVLEGQGHSFYEGFFRSQELVDFAISRARAGAEPPGK